jgi:tripartite-type tricarboxylate transporter receptor subunit TctC
VRKLLSTAALGVAAALVVGPAAAQSFPERPIKMIVPWAAGGDTDNIFRPLAPELQKHLGQPVVIANSGGRPAPSAPARPRTPRRTATPSTPCTTTSI